MSAVPCWSCPRCGVHSMTCLRTGSAAVSRARFCAKCNDSVAAAYTHGAPSPLVQPRLVGDTDAEIKNGHRIRAAWLQRLQARTDVADADLRPAVQAILGEKLDARWWIDNEGKLDGGLRYGYVVLYREPAGSRLHVLGCWGTYSKAALILKTVLQGSHTALVGGLFPPDWFIVEEI